jgi:quinol-cytochrome oxidoreductase complex cytochrome b subunit
MTRQNKNSAVPFSAFLLHIHPRTLPADTLRFTLSFGLGGMAATLVVLLFVSGLLQLLSYSPQTTEAYQSILMMYRHGGLAGFVRNCHYWAGNLLVIVAFLHLLRVYLTGAINGSRRYNWLVGIALFTLVLFANFTGYLMPWDQLAFWAVTIFTAMLSYIPFCGDSLMTLLRGGDEVGAETLSTFFAIHIGVIPALVTPLLIYHFWLIRKSGGLIRAAESTTAPAPRVPAIPNLVVREAAVGFSLLALVLLFSALVDAPLGDEANPAQSPNPAKAAWYFMGLQELLLHLHPSFAVSVVPLLILLFFASLPFWKTAVLPGGTWFGGPGGWVIAAGTYLLGMLMSFLVVLFDDARLSQEQASHAVWLVRGVVPTLGIVLAALALFMLLNLRPGISRAQALMGVVMLVCGSAVSFTLIGVMLRGPEMALVW